MFGLEKGLSLEALSQKYSVVLRFHYVSFQIF